MVCGGLNSPMGGLNFEEGKALFWHWIVPFSENNMVNTVKELCKQKVIDK